MAAPAVAPIAAGPCLTDVCVRALAPGVFALLSSTAREDLGANAGLVVTDAGTVLIDTGMPGAQARRLREELTRLTSKPLVAVILTHKHWDHTLGGSVVVESPVRVIAHDRTAAALAVEGPDLFGRLVRSGGELATLLAGKAPLGVTETVREPMTLELGGTRLELVPLAPAHTAGDLLVYLPAQKILFSGDVVVEGEFPYAADDGMNLTGWRQALDRVAQMDIARIVPGHGDVCGKEAGRQVRDFLDDLETQGRAAFSAGETPDTAAARLTTGVRRGWRGNDTAVDDVKELFRRQSRPAGAAGGGAT